jgi:hypothetical protein
MQIYYMGGGLDIDLDDEDVRLLREKSKLELELEKNRKFTFHVEDEVKSGMSEEPGFHIAAEGRLREAQCIDVYLGRDNFDRLVTDVPEEGCLLWNKELCVKKEFVLI